MSISDRFTIRSYQPGDEQEINDLHNMVFGSDRRLEVWRWKYDCSPRGAIKLISLLESDGQIVGQYANLLLDVKYRNQTYVVGQPVDMAIHPDYRGRRHIVDLFEDSARAYRTTNLPFGFGFPNQAAYPMVKKTLGYRDVDEILLLRYYMNPGLLLARFTRSARIMDWMRPLGNRLVRALYGWRWTRPVQGWTIEYIPSFDKRFDVFWEQMADTYPIMVARNSRYLNWRYVERPDIRYTTYAATREGQVQGYIVLSMERDIVFQGLVADLLAVDDATTEVLVKRALAHFLAQGVDTVSCWALPHTGLHRVLLRLAFFQRGVAAPLVCMVFDPDAIDEAFLCDPQNWYVTMGDSDGV